jgi:putative ABC transport system permease protein
MDRLRGLLRRLRALWAPGAVERELDEEVRFHLDMEAAAGAARGLTPAGARRAALVRFGGSDRYKEAARDVRGLGLLDDARRDLRHALRAWRSSPSFTATAVLTLALGIGANAAIFSVVSAVLHGDVPFADPDRLVVVWQTDRASGTRHEPASWPDVADYRARSRSLADIGVVIGQDVTLAGDGDAVRVAGLAVTPNLFRLLGVRPLLGRDFGEDEVDGPAGTVVLLGERFWRRRFGADPGVLGRVLVLDGRPAVVAGVVPAGAELGIRQIHARADYAPPFSGEAVDVWQVLTPTAAAFPRQTHPFLTLARLAPGADRAAAQAELAAIAADLEAAYPENADRGVNVEAWSAVVFGPVRPVLLVLLGAVVLVLLVTCANVATLLLARSASRAREVAVRLALGAGTARIRRQFLVEAGVLAAAGGIGGVALAYAGLQALVVLAPADIPRLDAIAVDGRVLAYTAAVAGCIALAFGVLPALYARRLVLHDMLKAQPGRRVTDGPATRRLRAALVVAEVALAVVLVVAAALLLRTVHALHRVDPGFATANVLKAQYQLPVARYPRDMSRWPELTEVAAFHQRFLSAVRALPGVEAAALAAAHPLDPGFTNSFVIVGREADAAELPEVRVRFITPGYLTTLGVRLYEGRDFGDGDDAAAAPVVLINRAAALRWFPDGEAVGRSLAFWGTARRIVGVIGDERFRGIAAPADPAVYAPLAQAPMQGAALLVRGRTDPRALVPAIRQTLHALDPQLALFGVEPLEHTLRATIARPRFTAVLLALFAGLAVVLAVVGVHGVMAYAVAQRMPEVGIRMALGASRAAVLRSVLADGLRLAGLGVALGTAAALAASRLLAGLVFDVTATDPATYGAVAAALLLSAAAAAVIPAARAARADPAASLRAD